MDGPNEPKEVEGDHEGSLDVVEDTKDIDEAVQSVPDVVEDTKEVREGRPRHIVFRKLTSLRRNKSPLLSPVES